MGLKQKFDKLGREKKNNTGNSKVTASPKTGEKSYEFLKRRKEAYLCRWDWGRREEEVNWGNSKKGLIKNASTFHDQLHQRGHILMWRPGHRVLSQLQRWRSFNRSFTNNISKVPMYHQKPEFNFLCLPLS